MNTCKTCTYWGISYGPDNKGRRDCDAIGLGLEFDSDIAYIDADATDDSGLQATLFTSPNFGCTLHEEKTDEQT